MSGDISPLEQENITRRNFLRTLGALAGGIAVQSQAGAGVSEDQTGTIRHHLPLPLSPFTVELLDENRGKWQFLDWAGQHLYLKGPVQAFAFTERSEASVRLAYLCCNPEFPRDPAHAVFRMASPIEGKEPGRHFRIHEPYFSCTLSVRMVGNGVWDCTLEDILLGPAITGDRYVEGLYLLADNMAFLIWLAPPGAGSGPQVRLLTRRVGNVFGENEPTRVSIIGLRPGPERELHVTLRAVAYDTGKPIWRSRIHLAGGTGRPASHEITLPLKHFGIFELNAESAGRSLARLRICRLPAPQPIHPDISTIGINIFQQQIWWYAFQVPLLAAAGVHWIRPWLAWENVWRIQEPQPGKWDFRALDAAVRRMDLYQMRYQDILYAAPRWVADDGVPPINPSGFKEWAEYVEKLVARYRGRIRYYEVWNEPDAPKQDGVPPKHIPAPRKERRTNDHFPAQTRVNARHYLAMLKTAWRAAKRADPDCLILGLSLRDGGNLTWLKEACQGGASVYMNGASIHIYVPPSDFLYEAQMRQRILAQHNIQRIWINEMGTTAYDFNPAYSAEYDCSEQKQAATLVADFAQARVLDPKMKTFWFCTYDPRDAAHQSGWTADAGIGVLYLGFLPKLAYAALAGFAKMVDGRRCLGYANNTREGWRQVSFVGPVAAAWCGNVRQDQKNRVPATRLGCLPQERISVRDMYTNLISRGNAAGVALDFSHGPLYIEGSRQMAGLASAEMAFRVEPEELTMGVSRTAMIALTAPPETKISATPYPNSEISARVLLNRGTGKKQIMVTVEAGEKPYRVFGVLAVQTTFDPPSMGLLKPAPIVRFVPITAGGGPNLIRDGGFYQHGLSTWTPQGNSAFALDTKIGHARPGCLRLHAPFHLRLVQWNIYPERGKPLHLKFWVKTENLAGCLITANLAWFGAPNGKWIETWRLATNGNAKTPGRQTIGGVGRIPNNTDWMSVAVAVPPMPPKADKAAFFIDARDGGTGIIYFDDLDLWQPVDR